MSQKRPFKKLDDQTQQDYTREARLQYDQKIVNESMQRWNSYTKLQKDGIMDEGNRIYRDIAAKLEAGKSATDSEVQELFVLWHEHLNHFYAPTLDLLQGLGQLYNSDPRFMTNFEKIHPQLPAFLEAGIAHYVDELETAVLERLLAEDATNQASQS